MIKVSILCFYLRIFPQRGFKRVIYAVIVGNMFYGAAFILLSVFQCIPVSGAWMQWDKSIQAKCMDANALAWASAALSILFDIVILVLPLPELVRLVMPWERKIRILLVFSLGFL